LLREANQTPQDQFNATPVVQNDNSNSSTDQDDANPAMVQNDNLIPPVVQNGNPDPAAGQIYVNLAMIENVPTPQDIWMPPIVPINVTPAMILDAAYSAKMLDNANTQTVQTNVNSQTVLDNADSPTDQDGVTPPAVDAYDPSEWFVDSPGSPDDHARRSPSDGMLSRGRDDKEL
jgi:hypothetical protein